MNAVLGANIKSGEPRGDKDVAKHAVMGLRGALQEQYILINGLSSTWKDSPDYGWAFPSLHYMAEMCGISKQAVHQRIKRLLQAGWIERRPRRRGFAYRCLVPENYPRKVRKGQANKIDGRPEAPKRTVNVRALTAGKGDHLDGSSSSGALQRELNKKILSEREPARPVAPTPDSPASVDSQLDLFAYRPPPEPKPEPQDQPDLFADRPPPGKPEPVPVPESSTEPDDPEFPDAEFPEDVPEKPSPVLKPQARRDRRTAGRSAAARHVKNLSQGLRKRWPTSRRSILATYLGELDGHPVFDASRLDYLRQSVLYQLCPAAFITNPEEDRR